MKTIQDVEKLFFAAKKAKIKPLNPQHIPLTIEKLREWSSFKDLNDKEAIAVKDSIETFGKILYEFIRQLEPINK